MLGILWLLFYISCAVTIILGLEIHSAVKRAGGTIVEKEKLTERNDKELTDEEREIIMSNLQFQGIKDLREKNGYLGKERSGIFEKGEN